MAPIAKGDVLAISKPFVCALLSEERKNRCEQCFAVLGKTKLVCSDCGYVYFCSLKCMSDSSASGFHAAECHLTALRPLGNLSRLIARVLLKLKCKSDKDEDDEDEAEDDSGRTEWIRGHRRRWSQLMDHYEDITHDPSAMHTFAYIYDELELLFDGSSHVAPKLSTLATDQQLVRIYGKILVNSFAVHESGTPSEGGCSLQQIGRAVYIGPSIFDHCCSPDVLFTFKGTTLHLIALRDLPNDDLRQVYISYVDEFETVEERRRQLKLGFYFDCGCSKCVQDTTVGSPLVILELPKLRLLSEKIENLYSLTNLESRYIKLAQKHLHHLQPSSLPKLSVNLNTETVPSLSLTELEQQNVILDLIERQQPSLEPELYRLESVLAVRVADFVAVTKANSVQLERLAAIYRHFYGDYHPRLLYKLYQFIGVLLEKVATIYAERRRRRVAFLSVPSQAAIRIGGNEEAQLESAFAVMGRLVRQARLIQSWIDDKLSKGVTDFTCLSTEECHKSGNRPYANRSPSYRNLLDNQNAPECFLKTDGQHSTESAENSGNDTRKQ